jgi:hypothetical protein
MATTTIWALAGEAEVLRSRARPQSHTARSRWRTVAFCLAVVFCACAPAVAFGAVATARSRQAPDVHRGQSAPLRRPTSMTGRDPRSGATPASLVFGIYPGGAAGTVGASGATKPENPAQRLAALRELRPAHRPFVLHLYAGYTGPDGYSAERQVGEQMGAYGRAGFETELALTYRPVDGGSSDDVAGFVGFVQAALRSLAHEPGFVSLQVTNEANAGGAPNAADGYYTGAADALIQGVIAAGEVVRTNHLSRIKVGFNWAYETNAAQRTFWSHLGQGGGPRFVAAVDWVGVDAYPGTWGPALGRGGLAASTGHFMDAALSRLRSVYMPLAGIGPSVPLVVTENGYPTGPGRTAEMQVTVLRAAVSAVYRARQVYNIAGYRWFDLRDADSSASSFESQYGLMRDDYSPKPAFGVYRQLVAEYDGH